MAWRAVARVQIYDDLWTWTKLCGCAGAVCFLTSDAVIAVNMFAFSVSFAHQIVMLTYYAAQFGISLSVVDSQADELIRIQKTCDMVGDDRMLEGMTFTIEPILCDGNPEIQIQEDGWTVVTQDGSRSAQFEHTILITKEGYEILTV
ncbi:Methionine aminopeptidase 1D, mitochondrial [Bulinus truncatus]|nr:Methionine aminopeptidase 1D, mitochondrial [Bulinus truncatus]